MKAQATALPLGSMAPHAKSLLLFPLLLGAVAPAGLTQAQNPEAIEIRVANNKEEGDALSFQTGLFTGQFVYQVPIVVPPGRNGTEPDLALRYSSGAGSGWCGVGWSLDVGYVERDTTYGVPVAWIAVGNTLTPAPRYEDTFVAAYSGVSSKLVEMSPGAYGPEVETSFVTFTCTADYWVATDRSGNKAYFGDTQDSRMEHPEWSSAPIWERTFRWCLSRTVDTNGNEVLYEYDRVGNQPLLNSIHYNGHPSMAPTHHVIFVRDDARLDKATSYRSNFRVETQSLLESIVIDVNGVVARSYEFEYSTSASTFRSRLWRIVERAADSSTKQATPLTFSYQGSSLEFDTTTENTWAPLLTEGQVGDGWKCPRGKETELPDHTIFTDVIDFDGDGLPDRIIRKENTHDRYMVQFNTGSGFDQTQLYPFDIEIQNTSPKLWGSIEWKEFGAAGGSETPMRLIDFNGDGRPDRIRRADWNGSGENLLCQFNNGWGLNAEEDVYFLDNQGQAGVRSWNSPEGYTDNERGALKAGLFDLTGDGRADRVMRPKKPPYNRFLVQENVTPYVLGTPLYSGFESNGNVPLTQVWPIEAQDGNYQSEKWNGPIYNAALGTLVGLFDLNGDGLLDRVMQEDGKARYPSGNNSKYDAFAVQFNNGAGFEPIEWWPIAQLGGKTEVEWNRPVGIVEGNPSEELTTLVDINGDGLVDRVMRYNGSSNYDHFEVQFNTGAAFQPTFTSVSVPEYKAGSNWGSTYLRNVNSHTLIMLDDMNGDGLVDRVMRRKNPPYDAGFAVQLNKGPFPDLLSGIDNGIGGIVQVSYAPSTRYDNRDREWKTTSPDPWSAGAKSLLPFTIQTVASVTTSDGVSPPVTRTYGYKNGMYDPASREFRGFNCVEETTLEGSVTKRISRTYFHQGPGSINKEEGGEFDDGSSLAKKGMPYLVEVFDENDVLLHQTISRIDELALGPGRAFPFVGQVVQFDHEGPSASNARGKATEYAYDTTGRLQKVTEWGEVDGDFNFLDHTFSDILGDTRYTHYTCSDPDVIDNPDRTWASSDSSGLVVLQDTKFNWNNRSRLLRQEHWLNLPLPAWLLDCNANGVEDEYDVCTGSSPDGNANQVPDECEVTSYCTAGLSDSGCTATMATAGIPSAEAASGFLLIVTDVEGAKDGMFFYGANGQQAAPWGTGYQCVVPPVKRGGLMDAPFGSTVGSCDGEFTQDLNALWCSHCPKPLHNPGVGAAVQAQFWYRDPSNTATNKGTTMSDAIEFVVGP